MRTNIVVFNEPISKVFIYFNGVFKSNGHKINKFFLYRSVETFKDSIIFGCFDSGEVLREGQFLASLFKIKHKLRAIIMVKINNFSLSKIVKPSKKICGIL